MTIQDLREYKLKPRQRLFCLYYAAGDNVTSLNAKESYKKAYTKNGKEPEDKYATDQGNMLLKNEEVSRCIQHILRNAQAQTDTFNSYTTLKTINTCSNYNIADYLDDKGLLKLQLSEMGEMAKAIEEVIPVFDGEGKFLGLKVKFCKRERFIEIMMKYLELIRPEDIQNNESSIIYVNPMNSETGYEQMVSDFQNQFRAAK